MALSRQLVTPPLTVRGDGLDGGVVPLSQGGGGNLLIHLRYVLVQVVGQDAEPALGVD